MHRETQTATRHRAACAAALIVLVSAAVLVDCGKRRESVEPTIRFTRLPTYGQGSSNRLEAIEGRATGTEPGSQVVLYARAGLWWIQPISSEPFTNIQSDSTWKNRTHPGSAYAALLVKPGYQPPLRTEVLPGKGGSILAVTMAEGPQIPQTPEKLLLFDGYQWRVREGDYTPGGTPNHYDPVNTSIDRDGFLHLRIAGSPNHWTSSEVSLPRSLGYGSYRFVVRDVSHLEPAVVFSMLTWDDTGASREMDIEISKWGELATQNAQFVIQPYHFPANTIRFKAPPGKLTFMLNWAPGKASFRTFQGAVPRWEAHPISQHSFTSGVPPAGNESVHLNLYVFQNINNPLRSQAEVIVEKFEYLP